MEQYRVQPDTLVKLSDWDPNDRNGFDGNKKQAEQELERLEEQLGELQELLYAEHKHKVLVILQAMDTGGKDGVIQHVFRGVDPQGVAVASFKSPTPREVDHDFLWRVHARAPESGQIVIFNRSHYEDVLIVRVHGWVTPPVWQRRYKDINHFEALLANEGTTIVKFYLNIDADEQKKRLQARLKDPAKHWKFNVADLKERQLWPEYIKAYEDAIGATSTPWAPWYIVPANHKWYRNLVISRVIVKTLQDLKMSYPPPQADLDKITVE